MKKLKIKKGDKVKVIRGKDRGREGVVVRVIPKEGKVIVKGINMVKKHLKPRPGNKEGGVITQEAPLWASKVMVVCPSCQKPTRIGYQLDKKGDKFRLCRRCQQPLDVSASKK